MYARDSLYILLAALLLAACGGGHSGAPPAEAAENSEAKARLTGIWTDDEAGTVVLRVVGDTIFYPDGTGLPAYFRVVGDTLLVGDEPAKYPIERLSDNIFWFRNANGDVVRLAKSREPADSAAFESRPAGVRLLTGVLKKDTVVAYGGARYHCYIAINPTKYKVIARGYSADGVGVDNVYYDNIIHISVFRGAERLYSRDISKRMYASLVPENFLGQAILSDMEFNRVDAEGFHFNATICVPDGASCYMLDTKVGFGGTLAMELIDY